ncbi:hypothetical protein AruPA_10950 [Acidiphilium sp. PA]|uniref:hypothetical protein n=1 Tax=Acidiphilium sp. PA TaxID=2871705 RepID=UPI002243C485|nr:hypothetical protein [Acidiphilium sp. PA]MCW8307556.1 hypothetical protein [Acidiphilium sp. PA]
MINEGNDPHTYMEMTFMGTRASENFYIGTGGIAVGPDFVRDGPARHTIADGARVFAEANRRVVGGP